MTTEEKVYYVNLFLSSALKAFSARIYVNRTTLLLNPIKQNVCLDVHVIVYEASCGEVRVHTVYIETFIVLVYVVLCNRIGFI